MSLRGDWQLRKRQLRFQLLDRLGKARAVLARHATAAEDDDDYAQHEQRFAGLLRKLLDIRQSLEHYRARALPLYCAACASLGADVWCVVGVHSVGKGADAEKFRHAMCAINETKEAKSHFFNADEVLAGALRFLDIHVNAMKSVRSQIEHRKRVKFDCDCYARKLRRLRAAAARASPQRVERNERKLQRARELLQAVTFELYRVFAKYESERDTMLNGELEMVRQVMHSFYAKNAAATDFAIPEDVDRAALDAKTQQIYAAMVAKELARHSAKAPVGSEDEAPEALEALGAEAHAAAAVAVTLGGAAPESLPSPPSALVAPAAPLALASSNQPLAVTDTTPPATSDDNNNSSACACKEEGERDAVTATPELETSEDELSEKLRTIQLSRPNVQPLKQSRWRSSA
ncbi:hypothetical protein PybrP1_002931 [[Pythium] brassicae (nom. inval.)]|nr:hypothetical protein PybrP1_002931 [[Pythium] brassicae (nom. inval.)]